jgi:sarcosine oxidase
MAEAGAPHALLSLHEASPHIPIARLNGSSALFDFSAGPTRARRAIECLLTVCRDSLIRGEVHEITPREGGYLVEATTDVWWADEVIIAAGINTGRLAEPFGLGWQLPEVHTTRFTYRIREEYRSTSLACWIDGGGSRPGHDSYGQRVGSTDCYAVGVGWGDVEGLSSEEEYRLSREKAPAYIREAYPGLEPEPVDEIRCSYSIHGLRDDGDGFMARRSGGITAIYGRNLFKFAPLLGELLAQTAVDMTLAPELDNNFANMHSRHAR